MKMTMNGLTEKQKNTLNRLNKLQFRACDNPETLVKISAGNYYFYSKKERELLVISDDSRENGGKSNWVVRRQDDNDYVNDYPTLKAFLENWI